MIAAPLILKTNATGDDKPFSWPVLRFGLAAARTVAEQVKRDHPDLQVWLEYEDGRRAIVRCDNSTNGEALEVI